MIWLRKAVGSNKRAFQSHLKPTVPMTAVLLS